MVFDPHGVPDDPPSRIPSAAHLTMRDYFAARALVGLIGISQAPPSEVAKEPHRICEIAYIVADAMLKRRASR